MRGETSMANQGAPRRTTWWNAAVAAISLAVLAVAGGAHAQKGNAPPTVTLAAASTSIATGQSTVLTATAKDDGTVVRVTIYDGGIAVAQLTSAPYTYTFRPTAPGPHTFSAVAIDNLLAQGQSNAVTVQVAAGSNMPPTATLTSSASAINLGAATFLQSTASDPDGTVSKVTFFSNGTQVAVVATPPYEYNYSPTATGNYTLTAVATDNGGATGTSNSVALTVNANTGGGGGGKGGGGPTVTLATNASTISVGNAATLTATATDADGVAKVEFYNGGTLVATDTSSPYTYNFAPSATGTFTITSRAYDTKGNWSLSNGVTIQATPGLASLPRVTLSLSNTMFSPGATVTISGNATATSPAAVAASRST